MRSLRRAFVLTALALAACSVLSVACGDDDATPQVTPDGGSLAVDSGSGIDSSPSTPADTGTGTPTTDGGADANDGSLIGTGLGLRVKFLGKAHFYGQNDESSLTDLLAADTALTPTRTENVATFDAAFLADVDVLVLDSLQRPYTEAEAQVLLDWVSAGHGLLSCTGFGNGADANNDTLLAKLGVKFTTYAGGGSNTIVPMIPGHPVTTGVSGLLVYGGRHVESTLMDASVELATLGGPVAMASTHGLGRSVLFGDDWILLDVEVNRVDDAGAKPTHAFWHNALLWAGHRL